MPVGGWRWAETARIDRVQEYFDKIEQIRVENELISENPSRLAYQKAIVEDEDLWRNHSQPQEGDEDYQNQPINGGEKTTRGYFVRCSVEIPAHRKLLLSNFPPCPSHEVITNDSLSSKNKELSDKLYGADFDNSKQPPKLTVSLDTKEDVVLHEASLKEYCRAGAVVKVQVQVLLLLIQMLSSPLF